MTFSTMPTSFLLRDDEDINDLNLSKVQKESEIKGTRNLTKGNKKLGRKRQPSSNSKKLNENLN